MADTPIASGIKVRAVVPADEARWRPLWDGYNAFYGRSGSAALPEAITEATWNRFFDDSEPMYALVAEAEGSLVGFTHYLFHRSTTRMALVCYLHDLFTVPMARGRGVARALIDGVYQRAADAGVPRVYWQTQENNTDARHLYDKVAKFQGFIVYSHDQA
ncbi:GNAT family N-acetyltransferase [Pinirhizobacter sp.]|uniref:GNAT family N-acetyltransferase n=1 Tax=Pinirhizobacter sp. TaxID=2950432 RepID=UPI002F418D47